MDDISELVSLVGDWTDDLHARGWVRQVLDGAGDDSISPFDPEAWATLSKELGLTGLVVPEALGGLAMAPSAGLAVATELGGIVAPLPWPSVIAATLGLRVAPSSGRASQLLGDILEGRLVVPVLAPQPSLPKAEPSGAEWIIEGHVDFVLDAPIAQDLLVPATGPDDVLRWFVTSEHTVKSRDSLDLLRSVGDVRLSDSRASLVAEGDDADSVLHAVTTSRLGLLLAEAAGVARRALQLAVDHASTRIQFGRPIGQFQAVKHRCVDILLDVELCDAAVDLAAQDLDASRRPASDLASAALFVPPAVLRVTTAAMAVLGGIGFTWEHDAHLYLRRARLLSSLVGPSAPYRETVATARGVA